MRRFLARISETSVRSRPWSIQVWRSALHSDHHFCKVRFALYVKAAIAILQYSESDEGLLATSKVTFVKSAVFF